MAEGSFRYCDVSLPVPLDRPFTYSLPETLQHRVKPGCRLIVPFGVRKMTGVAAERMGLKDRGVLREGNYADITVFDPATIADRATFENPHQPSAGIRFVLVNGRFTLDDGRLTGERPGRALRGPGWRGP